MRADKTRHLFDELSLMFRGHKGELFSASVFFAHLNASEKEISKLEEMASKQIPKKVNVLRGNWCPTCGSDVSENYCGCCGQALEW